MSDLIGLCFSLTFLQVHDLSHPRMDKDMVTAASPIELETEAFNEVHHIREGNVSLAIEKSEQELASVHAWSAMARSADPLMWYSTTFSTGWIPLPTGSWTIQRFGAFNACSTT